MISRFSKYSINIVFLCTLFFYACSPTPKDVLVTENPAPIFPDYIGVTIPENIAPLNFILRGNFDACQAVLYGECDSIMVRGKGEINFDIKKWHKLLLENDTLTLILTARGDGRWVQFAPIVWSVIHEAMDPYVSYRLIEPGYEVWHNIQLRERCIENYDERVIVDSREIGGNCFNCHIYGRNGESMYHLRGQGGGTMLAKDGEIRSLNIRVDSMPTGAVYGDFHPTGKYGIFSSNVIIPALHDLGTKRLEVYDTISDVFAVNFDTGDLSVSPLISRKDVLETFPTFSADGKKAYFCAAYKVALPDSIARLKYSLLSIDFDESTGQFGNEVDTIWDARKHNASVCHPKASPDGRWLMYTVADYGTFPIWHSETNLEMIDLTTGEINGLNILRSDRSETYHSWSSNSRWVAFASKRGDGLYGRVYFAYISPDGTPHKPFMLPQKHPRLYDNQLKSYNIPDISPTPSLLPKIEHQ